MIVSSMVPTRLPEESLTAAPRNCVARTECSPSRPVALKCLVLQLRLDDESLDGCPCDFETCAPADAASSEDAAQTIVIFRSPFFIAKFFCRFCFEKSTPFSAVLKQTTLGLHLLVLNGD